jgi:FkbM family methyltransferase
MTQDPQITLENVLAALPETRHLHRRGGLLYRVLEESARECSSALFGPQGLQRCRMGVIGDIQLPYQSFGAINSVHLFGLDELIIFSFYAANRRNYRRVADIGANIGLHSVVLAKLGYEVEAYEPDPRHLALLVQNLQRNDVAERVTTHQMAVSVSGGSLEFVRLLGNTTGSHLAGSKPSAYGEMERLIVPVVPFVEIMSKVDLVKLDVEGHEFEILSCTSQETWGSTDAMVEVGTAENAAGIFHHFAQIGVNLFSQKTGWRKVSCIDEMPTSHREGSLFISLRPEMNWS